jgi:hypothetical protein
VSIIFHRPYLLITRWKGLYRFGAERKFIRGHHYVYIHIGTWTFTVRA